MYYINKKEIHKNNLVGSTKIDTKRRIWIILGYIYWFLAFLAANPEFLSESALRLLEEDIAGVAFIGGTEEGAIISLPTTFFKAFIFA